MRSVLFAFWNFFFFEAKTDLKKIRKQTELNQNETKVNSSGLVLFVLEIGFEGRGKGWRVTTDMLSLRVLILLKSIRNTIWFNQILSEILKFKTFFWSSSLQILLKKCWSRSEFFHEENFSESKLRICQKPAWSSYKKHTFNWTLKS